MISEKPEIHGTNVTYVLLKCNKKLERLDRVLSVPFPNCSWSEDPDATLKSL
jgi:hypothetical protein